ncbi:MAG: CDP-glycerol glycerophosphotransferase family protein [Defluviitaleaceae bacterium]|nr:CDP-glycerol glycerophosphotransferase family protein [Defluviitaleaceae bacterium]
MAALAGLFAGRQDGIVLISCQDDLPSRDILDLAAGLARFPGDTGGQAACEGPGSDAGLDRVHGDSGDRALGERQEPAVGLARFPGDTDGQAARVRPAPAAGGKGEDAGFAKMPGDGGEQAKRDMPTLAAGSGSQDAPYIRVLAGKMRRSPIGAIVFVGKLFSMLRLTAKARLVVLDAYCPAISIPERRPGRTVVQLWHAPEAIKKFSLQIVDTPAGYDSKTAAILCMHRGYDYILCPSDVTRPYFAEAFGYPENVFVKLGLPSLDRIGQMKRPAPGMEEGPERRAARLAIGEMYPVLAAAPGRAGNSEDTNRVKAGEPGGDAPGGAAYSNDAQREKAGEPGGDAPGGAGNGEDAQREKAGETGGEMPGGAAYSNDAQREKAGEPGGEMPDGAGASALIVVYAPTFRDGAAADAAGLVRAFAEAMPETSGSMGRWTGITLILKLHPLDAKAPGGSGAKASGGRNADTPGGAELLYGAWTADGNAYHVYEDREFPLVDWYAAADVIITDYSGAAVEAAAAGVASYYYIYDIDAYKAKRGLNADLREEAVGKYAFADAGVLAAQMISDFSGKPPEEPEQPPEDPDQSLTCLYDYEALAAFAGKYLKVPLAGNTQKLTAFLYGLWRGDPENPL